jgi:molybdopterin converting factor small subunit
MIEVRLFATLREGRQKRYNLSEKDIVRVSDILSRLNIPPGEIAILLVNGRHSKPETTVTDGDLVALFPASGGG